MAALDLMESDSLALSRKAIDLALAGDTTALRMCLDRVVPVIKERPINKIELPQFSGPKSALTTIEKLAEALTAGELLPSEADAICKVLDQHRKLYETNEINERLVALERTLKMRQK